MATLISGSLPVPGAQATLSSCQADTNSHTMAPNEVQNIGFSITNTDTNAIQWMRVTVPSLDYTILDVNVVGWSVNSPGGTTSYFTGGTLNPGDNINFTIQTQAGNTNSAPNNWQVLASDDSGGSNPASCTGALDLQIQGDVEVPLQISNVRVEALTTHTAVVKWDTTKPATSQVDYGLDGGYGSTTGQDGNLVTSHSVSLSGLATNTSYHYQVTSQTAGGAESVGSGDNTFVTADEQAISQQGGVPGAGTSGITGANVPGVVVQATPTESTPPTVSIVTNLATPFKVVPQITGKADDNVAVARVEYSVDGGKNWLPVDSVAAQTTTTTTGKGKNKKTTTTSSPAHVTFAFTPVLTEDGDYLVVVRAIDTSSNSATTPVVKLVIDRLPPRFGAEVVSVGSQAMVPDSAGRWRAAADVDETITMNAVGGPVTATVMALAVGAKAATAQTFALRRDSLSGLWSGVMSFHTAQTYHLTVAATDGAGNHTSRSLPDVAVNAAAQLVASNGGRGVDNAKVTLYYRQPRTGDWVVWDGSGYGQDNPQRTNKAGKFGLLVPAGTYYLRAESTNYQTLVTRQFTLNSPTPLTPVIKLADKPHLQLGSWRINLPWVSLARTEVTPGSQNRAGTKASAELVGRALPAFSLPTTSGGTASAVGLLGKPTVVTVMATWAPASSEQLPALAKLQTSGDINVAPLVLGERTGRVQAFLSRAGYGLSAVVDEDASLTDSIGVPAVPVHYLVDRKGIVRAVLTGVVSADKLQNQLGAF